jgi:lysine 2,3-aminomutase
MTTDLGSDTAEPPDRGFAIPLPPVSLPQLLTQTSPRLRAPAPGLRPRRVSRFPCGTDTRAFRREFFAGLPDTLWNDWQWQVRERVRTMAELDRVFRLSPDERSAVARHRGSLPLGITPYYASRMNRAEADNPLRRTHIPVMGEYLRTPGEADDPLGEDHDAAVPGLIHRYPDRVLFLVTGFCSTYCRYCTRSRAVGNAGGEYKFRPREWELALDYLERHTEVRDVLLSGGDPLTLGDDKLDYLLGRLRAIPHIEFIRIGTKVPMVLPMRITSSLIRVLRKHRPVWMSVHATHPDELSAESSEAFERLADAGVPLGSQTVLLKGINDNVETMRTLFHGLLRRRVRPYYLYQCDPITGSAHFRTPVEKGIEIIEGLRGHTTGYAVPHFVVDAPGGGGKIPLIPDYLVGRDGEDLLLRNFEGGVYRYPDPDGTLGADRRPEIP